MPRKSPIWWRFAQFALLLLVAASNAPAAARGDTARGRSAHWRAPELDIERLRRDDDLRRERPGLPVRVGHPFSLALSPRDSGEWSTDPHGGRRWSLTLSSPGALWLVVGLEQFELPAAAQLFIRGASSNLGPFSAAEVREHGELWSPPLAGDSLTLELHWPAKLAESEPVLKVGTLSHGYEPWGGIGRDDPPQSASDSCHVDVACVAGDDWDDPKRGVVQLLSGGFAFCSGSLVNNTGEDCRPYVLTAAHCGAGPSTSFRFNYELDGCGGGTAPQDQILTGASVVASWQTSDFMLLELDDAPPSAFDVYYNGWRRTSGLIPNSTIIHHPQGQVKKISSNDDWLTDGLYWGGSHWRVQHWESGATQGGSSGAPLFDSQGRIVGQLHGGTVSCESQGWDEFGKLSFSFVGTGSPTGRLSDWLDPVGSGVSALAGLDASSCHVPTSQLQLAEVQIDDDEGNGNGRIEPGESVQLRLKLTNTGDADALGVFGSLTSPEEALSWINAAVDWPTIEPGSESWTTGAKPRFQLPPEWDCTQPIPLQLDVSETVGPGTSADWSLPVGDHGRSLLTASDAETTGAPWSSATVVGSGGWVISNARSYNGQSSWFIADAPDASEAHLELQSFVLDADDYKLRFRHYMDSEFEYDGGVLELRVGAGDWVDALPRLISGSYNSELEASLASSLGERQAWSGDLDGWQEVVLDLGGLAGQTVELRWRFASDASTGGEGWYVDDLEVWRDTIDCTPWSAIPLPELTELRLARSGDSLSIEWEPLETNGSAVRLYRRPINAPDQNWLCGETAGQAGRLDLPLPHGDLAFLVGVESGVLSGSLGQASGGGERTAADCP